MCHVPSPSSQSAKRVSQALPRRVCASSSIRCPSLHHNQTRKLEITDNQHESEREQQRKTEKPSKFQRSANKVAEAMTRNLHWEHPRILQGKNLLKLKLLWGTTSPMLENKKYIIEKNTSSMLPLFWNFEKQRLSTSWTTVFSHPTPLICNPQLLIKSCNGSRPVSGDAILLKHPGCVKL